MYYSYYATTDTWFSSKNSKEEEDIMLDDYIEQDDDPKLFLDPEDNDEKFLSLEKLLTNQLANLDINNLQLTIFFMLFLPFSRQ